MTFSLNEIEVMGKRAARGCLSGRDSKHAAHVAYLLNIDLYFERKGPNSASFSTASSARFSPRLVTLV